MMNGGQPIDPGLVQALGNISTAPEQQQQIQEQMAMAQAMRDQAVHRPNQMAGQVVVRQSPLANLANLGTSAMGGYQQHQGMMQQQKLADTLRDVRGQYISKMAALQDPSQLHPASQAALGMNSSAMDPNGGSVAQNNFTPGYDAQPGEASG